MSPTRAGIQFMYAACGLFLVVYLLCGVAQVRVGAPAAGSLPTSWPARLGGVTVAGEAEARFRLQAASPGTRVPVEAGGGTWQIPIVPAYGTLHLVITFGTALLFWAACVVVFVARSGSEPARTFLWASLAYGLAIVAGDVYFPPPPTWPNVLVSLARVFALLATPTLFLRIAFIFPRPDPRIRGDRIVLAVAVVAAALFAWEAGALLDYVARGGPAGFARLEMARRLGNAFLALLVLGGSGYLARTTERAVLARERHMVKWVAWGAVVGALPFATFHALPTALGLPPVLPLEIARAFAIVVPISFAIAVARHHFMDIDVIIRRSLIYGTMAALLTVTYLVIGLWLGVGLGTLDTGDGLRILAAGAAVALFSPTRRVLGRWVDGAFFHLRAGLDREAAAMREAIAPLNDPAAVAHRVAAGIRGALGPRQFCLVVPEDSATDPIAAAALEIVAAAPRGARGAPEATAQPELETAPWPPALAGAGIVLVQPLIADAGPVGALLLGSKTSDRRYVEEDLTFLAHVGQDAGRALERLALSRQAATESLLRAQQEELDRRKTAFLTRVAHDLRTPLTSILWASQNVLDGVAGPIDEAVERNLLSIRAAAGHLGRLVENLLEIARLDGDQPIGPLDRVAAGTVIDEALLTLAPIARARDVRLVAKVDATVPPVRAQREGLTRVVLNLVENAIRFSPAGGQVDVGLARGADGAPLLTVRDRGPGVPVEERGLVFERFRQGRAAAASRTPGVGAGFGIGLSLVKDWLDRFDGAVGIEAPEDGGARFVCRLRPWTP